MSHVLTPHLKWPMDLRGRTHAPEVEQDSVEDIALCTEAVLRYQPGFRLLNLGFGYPDQTFSQGGPDLDLLDAQLEEYEPRARAVVSDVSEELWRAGTVDEAVRIIRVALED